MTERPDYLWDGTGSDPEVEQLEELFGQLRVPSAPPALPSRRRRGPWIAAAALLALAGGAVVLSSGPDVQEVVEADVPPVSAPTARRDATDPAAVVAQPAPPEPPTPWVSTAPRVRVVEGEPVVSFVPGPVEFEEGVTTHLFFDEDGTVYGSPGSDPQAPRLSPDGSQVSFELLHAADKRRELWIAELNGTQILGLTRKGGGQVDARSGGATRRVIHQLAWAHVGPFEYAYTVSDDQGTQDIHIDNWSDAVRSPGAANMNPDWDSKSARFVFSSGRTGNGDLYLWDQGTELQLTYDERNTELYPKLSPDGTKVTFVRAGAGSSHIMLLDINMFTSLALVQWVGAESTRPSFSPDGSKVAFFSNKSTDSVRRFGLWVTDARPGGTPQNIGALVKLPTQGAAHWTPDGKGIVAVLDDPERYDPICIFPIDGGSPDCLDLGTDLNRDPSLLLTEDGLLLAWTSLRGSSRQLNIARLEFD